MTENEKREILAKAKEWFENTLIQSHLRNVARLTSIDRFNINPFTVAYIATFLAGNTEPLSLAKALIYPRALGTSINTSFGQRLQNLVTTIFDGYGSAIDGFDIEFDDQIDGNKIYCQLKGGPNTINRDDIATIIGSFDGAVQRARYNNLRIADNVALCILYGEESELNTWYREIQNRYPIYIGKGFWHRLTGDENFYFELADAFASAAIENGACEELNDTVNALAETQEIQELSRKLNQ